MDFEVQQTPGSVPLRVVHSCHHVETYQVPNWMSGVGRWRMVVRLSSGLVPGLRQRKREHSAIGDGDGSGRLTGQAFGR